MLAAGIWCAVATVIGAGRCCELGEVKRSEEWQGFSFGRKALGKTLPKFLVLA